jgi:hypothetical protein
MRILINEDDEGKAFVDNVIAAAKIAAEENKPKRKNLLAD